MAAIGEKPEVGTHSANRTFALAISVYPPPDRVLHAGIVWHGPKNYARALLPLVRTYFDVFPLVCPACGGAMRIIAFIADVRPCAISSPTSVNRTALDRIPSVACQSLPTHSVRSSPSFYTSPAYAGSHGCQAVGLHVARCPGLKALEGHGTVRRPAHPIR